MLSYLPLPLVTSFVPSMKLREVSEVARSPDGFVEAYAAAGGSAENLDSRWEATRNRVLAMHLAQARTRSEPLFNENGFPTRRHLALVAWAYSPCPARLREVARVLRRWLEPDLRHLPAPRALSAKNFTVDTCFSRGGV